MPFLEIFMPSTLCDCSMYTTYSLAYIQKMNIHITNLLNVKQ